MRLRFRDTFAFLGCVCVFVKRFYLFKWSSSRSRIQTLVDWLVSADCVGDVVAVVVRDASVGEVEVGNVAVDAE